MKELTGQDLADALQTLYQDWGQVSALDLGGGWIEIYGNNLKPAPELTEMFPNGWCLLDRMRYSEAREKVKRGHK